MKRPLQLLLLLISAISASAAPVEQPKADAGDSIQINRTSLAPVKESLDLFHTELSDQDSTVLQTVVARFKNGDKPLKRFLLEKLRSIDAGEISARLILAETDSDLRQEFDVILKDVATTLAKHSILSGKPAAAFPLVEYTSNDTSSLLNYAELRRATGTLDSALGQLHPLDDKRAAELAAALYAAAGLFIEARAAAEKTNDPLLVAQYAVLCGDPVPWLRQLAVAERGTSVSKGRLAYLNAAIQRTTGSFGDEKKPEPHLTDIVGLPDDHSQERPMALLALGQYRDAITTFPNMADGVADLFPAMLENHRLEDALISLGINPAKPDYNAWATRQFKDFLAQPAQNYSESRSLDIFMHLIRYLERNGMHRELNEILIPLVIGTIDDKQKLQRLTKAIYGRTNPYLQWESAGVGAFVNAAKSWAKDDDKKWIEFITVAAADLPCSEDEWRWFGSLDPQQPKDKRFESLLAVCGIGRDPGGLRKTSLDRIVSALPDEKDPEKQLARLMRFLTFSDNSGAYSRLFEAPPTLTTGYDKNPDTSLLCYAQQWELLAKYIGKNPLADSAGITGSVSAAWEKDRQSIRSAVLRNTGLQNDSDRLDNLTDQIWFDKTESRESELLMLCLAGNYQRYTQLVKRLAYDNLLRSRNAKLDLVQLRAAVDVLLEEKQWKQAAALAEVVVAEELSVGLLGERQRYSKALPIMPTRLKGDIALALSLVKTDGRRAQAIIEASMNQCQGSFVLTTGIARALLDAGLENQCKQWFNQEWSAYSKLLVQYPDSAYLMAGAANTAASCGQLLGKAKELIDGALKSQPENPEFLCVKAEVCYAGGDLMNAVKYTGDSLKLRSRHLQSAARNAFFRQALNPPVRTPSIVTYAPNWVPSVKGVRTKLSSSLLLTPNFFAPPKPLPAERPADKDPKAAARARSILEKYISYIPQDQRTKLDNEWDRFRREESPDIKHQRMPVGPGNSFYTLLALKNDHHPETVRRCADHLLEEALKCARTLIIRRKADEALALLEFVKYDVDVAIPIANLNRAIGSLEGAIEEIQPAKDQPSTHYAAVLNAMADHFGTAQSQAQEIGDDCLAACCGVMAGDPIPWFGYMAKQEAKRTAGNNLTQGFLAAAATRRKTLFADPQDPEPYFDGLERFSTDGSGWQNARPYIGVALGKLDDAQMKIPALQESESTGIPVNRHGPELFLRSLGMDPARDLKTQFQQYFRNHRGDQNAVLSLVAFMHTYRTAAELNEILNPILCEVLDSPDPAVFISLAKNLLSFSSCVPIVVRVLESQERRDAAKWNLLLNKLCLNEFEVYGPNPSQTHWWQLETLLPKANTGERLTAIFGLQGFGNPPRELMDEMFENAFRGYEVTADKAKYLGYLSYITFTYPEVRERARFAKLQAQWTRAAFGIGGYQANVDLPDLMAAREWAAATSLCVFPDTNPVRWPSRLFAPNSTHAIFPLYTIPATIHSQTGKPKEALELFNLSEQLALDDTFFGGLLAEQYCIAGDYPSYADLTKRLTFIHLCRSPSGKYDLNLLEAAFNALLAEKKWLQAASLGEAATVSASLACLDTKQTNWDRLATVMRLRIETDIAFALSILQSERPRAITIIKSTMQQSEGMFVLADGIAQILLDVGLHDECKEWCDSEWADWMRLTDQYPGSMRLAAGAALTAATCKQNLREADGFITSALAAEPRNSRFLGIMAEVRHAQGDSDGAVRASEECLMIAASHNRANTWIFDNKRPFLVRNAWLRSSDLLGKAEQKQH